MTEKYNIKDTINGTENASFEKAGWIIDIYKMPGGFQDEFAPATDFYHIQKRFHSNGQIASTGKFLGYVKFSTWEYYDENGNLSQLINEDTKFRKIKPKDIIDFLQKEKIIDRKNGKNIFTKETLKTDGSFYKETMKYLKINLMPKEEIDQSQNENLKKFLFLIKEETPIWLVSYFNNNKTNEIIYYIDGNNIDNFIKEEIISGYII